MCQHLVCFYDDAFPADAVSEFLAAGLRAGDTCLALLTAPHQTAVEKGLRKRGVHTASTDFLAIDTDAMLARCRIDGRLALDRAGALLTPLMKPSGSTTVRGTDRRVRAVGDLAPTLCAAGEVEDAVAFEALVHRLAQEHGAAVICPYPIEVFARRADMDALFRLSAEHARVEFPEQLWVRGLMSSAAMRAPAEH